MDATPFPLPACWPGHSPHPPQPLWWQCIQSGEQGQRAVRPIQSAAGAIPALYGGTTSDCAAMERLFHDVPIAMGLKTFDQTKLA
jgi:hypothetical protein